MFQINYTPILTSIILVVPIIDQQNSIEYPSSSALLESGPSTPLPSICLPLTHQLTSARPMGLHTNTQFVCLCRTSRWLRHRPIMDHSPSWHIVHLRNERGSGNFRMEVAGQSSTIRCFGCVTRDGAHIALKPEEIRRALVLTRAVDRFDEDVGHPVCDIAVEADSHGWFV
jgi:hypothetical protein